MIILPRFQVLSDESVHNMRAFLGEAMTVLEKRNNQSASVAASIIKSILDKRGMEVAEFDYFRRAWTLAERLARYGRGERLCHWMSLESWIGMVINILDTVTGGPAVANKAVTLSLCVCILSDLKSANNYYFATDVWCRTRGRSVPTFPRAFPRRRSRFVCREAHTGNTGSQFKPENHCSGSLPGVCSSTV